MAELPKFYEPKDIETKISALWEEGGFFRADSNSSKPSYSLVMPPPNVTGVLHMGHALVNTLQDILVRYKRMSGFETLWIPGTDHAGIATQTVVERNLIAQYGKRRTEWSREEFLGHVFDWKEKSEKVILDQIKRLGCSADFSRLAFTMDPVRNRAVRTLFKILLDKGLVYRGDYLVNWDPVTQTALADDELEYEEQDGALYHIRYPIEGEPKEIVIATTRPETMLGDTAVMVSPKDFRYQDLIGKQVSLPITGRLVPIIADNYVDPDFGTGAVKVTPAHDPNDYQVALRHNLPMINIMTKDGRINENGGAYAGLLMSEARTAISKELNRLGFLVKQEPHPHRVAISYRSKAVIEPHLSKQWFVNVRDFKEHLIGAVRDKRLKLIPEQWESTYFHWIENLRDWCISRQLWWGHRIPVWYDKRNRDHFICYAEEGVPPEVAQEPEMWEQEEDVLDTWFSSALWPCSTLGWPDKTVDLKKFYPNATLITGHDILFFWVARMTLVCECVMDELPFKETYLHGLIYGKSYWRYLENGAITYVTGQERLDYDLGLPLPNAIHFKWEKMSKSKGNIIDPLEMIDLYGTDAVRMAITSSATSAAQIDLDRRKFEEFKNFTNKLWNGARFIFMNLSSLSHFGIHHELLKVEDRWILSMLGRAIKGVTAHLEEYAFDKAATLAYDFFWKELCAYYLEVCKPILFGKRGTQEEKENKQNLLFILLCNAIRLIHPMAPFITEELFSLLKGMIHEVASVDPYVQESLTALQAQACCVAPYPTQFMEINLEAEDRFANIHSLVHAVRNIRAEMQLPPNIATDLLVVGKDLGQVVEDQSILLALLPIKQLQTLEQEPELPFSAGALVGSIKLIIPLPEELRQKEQIRLVKEQERLIEQQNQMRAQLGNQAFIERAPPHVVEKLRSNLAQLEKELIDLMKKL